MIDKQSDLGNWLRLLVGWLSAVDVGGFNYGTRKFDRREFERVRRYPKSTLVMGNIILLKRLVRLELVYSKSSRMLGATKNKIYTHQNVLEFVTIREYPVEKNHLH